MADDDIFSQLPLKAGDDAAWKQLAHAIAPGARPKPVEAIVSFLRDRAQAGYVIAEKFYIDRDHRAANSVFYSRQFRALPSTCTRFHFFGGGSEWAGPPSTDFPGAYLGYVVKRPIGTSPIGRTVLAPSGFPNTVTIPCTADFGPHIGDAQPQVRGVPFASQDAAVMSCAETSIWMSTRVLTKLFRHQLILPSQIPFSLEHHARHTGWPVPSSGLTLLEIRRALISLGCSPALRMRRVEGAGWDAVEDGFSYVASGIPAILAMPRHAVVACGAVLVADRTSITRQSLRTVADWVEALVIHDDQWGPYRVLVRHANGQLTGADPMTDLRARWTCADINGLCAPAPDKVYLTVSDVKAHATGFLTANGTQWANRVLPLLSACNYATAKELVTAVQGATDGVVMSIRCRRSADVRSEMVALPHDVRAALWNTPLPRHVWSVEFTTYRRFIGRPNNRAVLGELLFDATEHDRRNPNMLLFARFPGFALASRPLAGRTSPQTINLADHPAPLRDRIPGWSDVG